MIQKKYDYLLVGAGLYNSILAYRLHQQGKRCLVIERRPHIGGNIYTEECEGIHIHLYGPHIFHTSNNDVWNFASQFIHFNHFRYNPLAHYKGKLYNLPFNMHTFYQLYGTLTPDEAVMQLQKEREIESYINPTNLEEKAISMVGRSMYEVLIKGYTEKQWGRPCEELPPFIIERLPLRFSFDNNYFNDAYQGIPIEGYTHWIKQMLKGVEVRLNTDFHADREYWLSIANRIIYTGSIDALFNFQLGALEYRSLRFEHNLCKTPNVQGVAVINETDVDIPYTRVIEHKHFAFGNQPVSIVTYEYPQAWDRNKEAFYPINNSKNTALYLKYLELAKQTYPQIDFGGRLGLYKYLNMDDIVKIALNYKF